MDLPRYCLLFVRAACFLSADSEDLPSWVCHTLHSDHKIMKGAVKICDITGSHTEVNIFLPTRKIALHDSFKFQPSTVLKLQTVNCHDIWVVFAFTA